MYFQPDSSDLLPEAMEALLALLVIMRENKIGCLERPSTSQAYAEKHFCKINTQAGVFLF